MTRISVVSDVKSASVMPTRGTLGISAQAFLTVLSAQKASGTLYLSRTAGNGSGNSSVLLSLGHGEPQVKSEFGAEDGATFDFAQPGATFSWWPPVVGVDAAGADAVPTLRGRYAQPSGVLWALPTLSEQLLLSTTETGLRELAARLSADGFSGAVVLTAPPLRSTDLPSANLPGTSLPSTKLPNTDPSGTDSPTFYGLLLFYQGQLGGAVYEAGAVQQGGAAALRTLTQLTADLVLHALPEPVAAGLLGWLLGLSSSDASVGDASPRRLPEGFSGLELSATGAHFYRAGTPYLLQLRPPGAPVHADALGLFAACQRVPTLTLPGEPSGWEGRRYGLTLRGRDALNPMTELSMRFQGEFGRSGRRALEQFRRDLSVEVAAGALGLEVAELGGLVERLEAEGFVRTVGDVSPTAYLQPR